MNAHEAEWRLLEMSATVADAYDGVIRLFSDLQKFGFRTQEFHLAADKIGGAELLVTIILPSKTDIDFIRARLSRHPTIVSMVVAEAPSLISRGVRTS